MSTAKHISTKHHQRGAALMISLMLLLVISVIGVTAMRTSMFNAKISTSVQASSMTFNAAESALTAVFREADMYGGGGAADGQDNIVALLLTQLDFGTPQIIERCVTAADSFVNGACTAADAFDNRGLLQASSQVVVDQTPVGCGGGAGGGDGSQISSSGEGSSMVRGLDYQFVAVGRGRMDVLDMDAYVVQEFARCIQTPVDGNNI